MIKKIINNFLEMLKSLLKNKVVIVFFLSMIGITNAGQYFFIPPHLHYKQPNPIIEKKVIHKTVTNKVECGHKCEKKMKSIGEWLILEHVKTDH